MRATISVVFVPGGLRGKAVGGAVEIVVERIDGVAQLQHQRGVDHVLAGGAPMHEACGFAVALGDFRRQRLHQRNGDVAGRDRVFGDLSKIEAIGAAGGHDRACGRGGNDAGVGFRLCQRRLEIQHPLQPRRVIHHGTHGRAGKQRREQGGG